MLLHQPVQLVGTDEPVPVVQAGRQSRVQLHSWSRRMTVSRLASVRLMVS